MQGFQSRLQIGVGVGITTDYRNFCKSDLSEITVIGTYTYTHADLEEALKILHSGALGELSWIEERPLSEGAAAFSDLNDGFSAASKIVLQPLL